MISLVWLESIDELKRTHEPVRFKVRIRRRDSKIVWLLGVGIVIQDSGGDSASLYTFRDLTEWQLMEDELARQESLMDNIVGGVELCEYADDFPIVYMSNGFLNMTGYTRNEIANLFENSHLTLIYPPDAASIQKSMMLQLKEKLNYSEEYRIQRKDGKIMWVLDKGVLISSETENPLVQSILTDITAQKEAQEALRISEKRYLLVMNFSDVAVFDYDIITGRMIHHRFDVNEYHFPSVMDNVVETLIQTGAVAPESVDTFRALYSKIHNGEPSAEAIIYTKDPDEETRVVQLRLTTIYDDYGRPARAVGVKKDITETFNLKREKEYGDTLTLSKQLVYEANVTQDKITNCSELWLRELNLSPAQIDAPGSMTQVVALIGENMVAPEHKALFLEKSSQDYIVNAFECSDRLITFEYLKKTAENTYLWYEKTLNIIKDEASGDINIRCYLTNINERKKKEEQLQAGTQHFEALLSKSITVFDVNFTKNLVISGHEAWGKQFGIKTTNRYSDILESLYEKALHPEDRNDFYKAYQLEHILSSYASGDKGVICEYRWPDENGDFIWVRSTLHLFQDSNTGNLKGLFYIENIDAEKKKKLELVYKSQHDLLTGFYNKITVAEKINAFLSTSDGKAGKHVFFIIDLDYFKQINDNFGHAFGDAVLSQISAKVKTMFRDDDILGRIGGDEFVIFMKNIHGKKQRH